MEKQLAQSDIIYTWKNHLQSLLKTLQMLHYNKYKEKVHNFT